MAIKKLVDADFTGKGVTGLADTPKLSTLEMQKKFDELSRDVLTPKINEIIDQIIDENHHLENFQNPHSVTPEQIGAVREEFVRDLIATSGGGGAGITSHSVLENRDAADQHPIAAISGLTESLAENQAHRNNYSNPHMVTIEQIGAAPSGFGLGKIAAQEISHAGIDEAISNGWYAVDTKKFNESPVDFNGVLAERFLVRTDGDLAIVSQSAFLGGYVLRRYKSWGVWSPWEWENPPMLEDVVYRTTQRFNGFPVYVKRIIFPQLPNTTSVGITTGIESSKMISVEGHIRMSDGKIYPLPYVNSSGNIAVWWRTATATNNLMVQTNSDMSANSAEFTIRFID